MYYSSKDNCYNESQSFNKIYVRIGNVYEPRHEKTCLQDLRPGKTQTGLLSYRDKLVSWNFGYRN